MKRLSLFCSIFLYFSLANCSVPIVEKSLEQFACEDFHDETIYIMWTDGCFHSLHKIYSQKYPTLNPIALKDICHQFFVEMSHGD